MDMNQFSEWAAAHGIKQKDVAELTGLSISTISGKFSGKTAWMPHDLKKIHEAYGLSADFVLGLSPYPYGRPKRGGSDDAGE